MPDTPPPDAGGSNNGSNRQDPPPSGEGYRRREGRSRSEIESQVRRLIERRGGGEKACLDLMEELFEAREQVREARHELKRYKQPGAALLTKADADELAAFRALGVKPDDAKKQLGERATLVAENAGLRQQELTRQVSALEGYGYEPTVLADLLKSKGLTLALSEIEVKDEKGVITKRPGATVRPEGKPASEAVELASYIEKELKAYLPALQATGSAGTAGSPAATGRPVGTPSGTGTPWPMQSGPRQPDKPAAKDEDIAKDMRATGAYAGF